MTGHLRCRRSFQRTSGTQCKAATLFSLFEPSGLFTLQLNLSWRHSRSSLGLLFFFNYVHCKLDLLLTLTASQSDRHRRARGLAGFSRWRWTEQRRSWNCGAPSASDQRSTGSFTCDWEKENVKKAQCTLGVTWKRAKRLPTWQGSRWTSAKDVSGIAEKTETWCSLIADSLAQNKPVVSSRHLKRNPKTTRETAATAQGKTELDWVQPLVVFPMQRTVQPPWQPP